MNTLPPQSMQQRVDAAEASYIRLLNHLPGIAYRCKTHKNYYYTLDFISKGSFRLLGLEPEELLQKESNVIEQMMMPEDLERIREQIYDKIVANLPYSVVYRATLHSGQKKWIWDQGSGVYDAEGHCIFLEGLMLDITDIKEQELRLKEENSKLRLSIKSSYALGDMVGKSVPMQQLYRTILKAADNDTNIILYGETGVGKDLAARTIHELSGVKGRYVPVNCAAIPEQLLESEFFGHVKGAFTGAVSHHVGYLAAANGGTLFLDEIAELPIKLQVKLLRAIESRSYTPVGSTEVKQSKFRLISATNQNLVEMVRMKALRADFYYRIHVLAINIPPLRARIGDLPLLIDMYARERGIQEPLPASVYLTLEGYAWPGNIRELQNVLDRYWAFGDTGIEWHESLAAQPAYMHGSGGLPAAPAGAFHKVPYAGNEATRSVPPVVPLPADYGVVHPPRKASLRVTKGDVERQHIMAALFQHGWRKGETAAALGVTLRTLPRKIKQYAIIR